MDATDDTEVVLPHDITLGSSRHPSEKEIQNMASNLGIDLKIYPQMVDLVVKAIKQPIPDNWAYLKNSSKFCCIDMEN